MEDAFDLQRFVSAQEPVFDAVVAELQQGNKTGHWMWFIFPQLKGLGSSPSANHFGISSLAEAKAYLEHETLGSRLVQYTKLMNGAAGSAEQILGDIDSMKFRSSMTLFAQAAQREDCFEKALTKFFAGKTDQRTLDLLARKQQTAEA